MPVLAAFLVIALWLYMPYHLYRDAAFDPFALVQRYTWLAAFDFAVLVALSALIIAGGIWIAPKFGRDER